MTEVRRSKRLAHSAPDPIDASVPPAKRVRKSPVKKPSEPAKPVLKVGDTVEDVELKNEKDESVHVLELVKEKGAVFFMFPRANTPGCTKQACGFRDHHEEFTAAGYNVFALAQDAPKSLTTWQTGQKLPYTLLSDKTHALIGQFGSSKDGKKKIQRSHVIVAKGGVVADIQAKVTPQESVDKALAFCKKDTTPEA
ncbi:peroxiredoxin [Thraustotheca clavata]|uniref:thioredoxin-dependent peroxiredoxin n=1 Tax=Thraustotheca clavata TaxID=74557 RepID=A0A1V9ZHB8_9STRA|nr:peroxiredoxin [Thraustotheca clavata]